MEFQALHLFLLIIYLGCSSSIASSNTRNVYDSYDQWGTDPDLVEKKRTKSKIHVNQGCSSQFLPFKNSIIKTQESINNGAKFILVENTKNIQDCLEKCCIHKECTTAIYETQATGQCFLFNCAKPNSCSFTNHLHYITFQRPNGNYRKPHKLSPTTAPEKKPTNGDIHKADTSSIKHNQAKHESRKSQKSKSVKPTMKSNDKSTLEGHKNTLKQSHNKNRESHADQLNSVAHLKKHNNAKAEKPGPSKLRSPCTHPGLQFQCADPSRKPACVAIYDRCNGIQECGDGSDEVGCASSNLLGKGYGSVPDSAAGGPLPHNRRRGHVKPPHIQQPTTKLDAINIANAHESKIADPSRHSEDTAALKKHKPALHHMDKHLPDTVTTTQSVGIQDHPPPETPYNINKYDYIYTNDRGSGRNPAAVANYYDLYNKFRTSADANSDNIPYDWHSRYQNAILPDDDDNGASSWTGDTDSRLVNPTWLYQQQKLHQEPDTYERLDSSDGVDNVDDPTDSPSSKESSSRKHKSNQRNRQRLVPKKPVVPTIMGKTDDNNENTLNVAAPPSKTVPHKVKPKIKLSRGDEDTDSLSTADLNMMSNTYSQSRVAIVALSLSLMLTFVLLIFVGCRLRSLRRRLRRGGKALQQDEADYLINGMYL